MQGHVETESENAGRSAARSMKLVVLGATGGTGLELVRQAIERGHSVTALVRSPDRLGAFRDRITVKQGDLLNPAMARAGVRRVVVESVAFLFRDSIVPPAYLLGRLLFPLTVADASAMERVFAESDLDWTMARPPELTDKPYTGKYRVREGHLPRFGFKISRADVADFMIQVVDNRSSIRKVVGVCN